MGGTESIWVAVVSGAISTTGAILQLVYSGRKTRRDAERKQQEEAPDRLRERLKAAEDELASIYEDNATLRAKYQESLDTRDNLIEEIRALKRQLEEARIEIHLYRQQRRN